MAIPKFIHRHFWAVILISSLLVGVLYAAPPLFLYFNVRTSGQSFMLKDYQDFGDEAHGYLPRIREVFDGHIPPSDLYFDAKAPTIYNALPPVLFYPLMYIFRDVNPAYLGASFVFPSILFAMFYFLGIAISKNRLGSIFFAFLGTLTPIFHHLPSALFALDNFLNVVVKNFYPGVKTLLSKLFLSRVDDPLLTFLVYLPAILFFWKFWEQPERRKFAILAGVFAGLLFYSYFHYWVYWVIVLGLAGLWTFIRRKKEPARFMNIFLLLLTVLLVSFPYFISYYQFSRMPSAGEFGLRLGLEIGRGIRFLSIWPHYLVYGITGFLAAACYCRKDRKKVALFFIFLAAMVVVWNIQLVTGYVPHPDHFRRAISPVLFVLFFSLSYDAGIYLSSRWGLLRKIIPVSLLILMVLLISKKVINASKFIYPPEEVVQEYTVSTDIAESWRWIESNLPGEPRILSSSTFTSLHLVSFTSARPYVPGQVIHMASNFEVEERYLKANKIFEVPWETIEESIQGDGREHINLYAQYFRKENKFDIAFADTSKWIPEEYMNDLRERYKKMDSDLASIEADYIYIGPEELTRSSVDFLKETDLKLIFSNPSVQIFKITH